MKDYCMINFLIKKTLKIAFLCYLDLQSLLICIIHSYCCIAILFLLFFTFIHKQQIKQIFLIRLIYTLFTQIFLSLIKTLHNIKQLHIQPINQLCILILNFHVQEKVLKLSHTRQNPVRQLIHEKDLIILYYNDSFLEGLK